MSIPRGTRQLVSLREAGRRIGVSYDTIKHWWRDGQLLGRYLLGAGRPRVTIPIEVVEFCLRYHRLPTKREIWDTGALDRGYLLELNGPDGGLSEASESGTFS